ncbi:MAG: hypothetical protein AVDCRST_MAG24-464, partial [uncultured Nocardioidaceae bacterium]
GSAPHPARLAPAGPPAGCAGVGADGGRLAPRRLSAGVPRLPGAAQPRGGAGPLRTAPRRGGARRRQAGAQRGARGAAWRRRPGHGGGRDPRLAGRGGPARRRAAR